MQELAVWHNMGSEAAAREWAVDWPSVSRQPARAFHLCRATLGIRKLLTEKIPLSLRIAIPAVIGGHHPFSWHGL